jgi:hypothetical protein
VAFPLSGAAIVEVDIGAGAVLLGRVGKEITSMELVGVGGGDELRGRDGRPGGDEAGITIELVSEVVEKVEELAIVLGETDVDGDGELRLNCTEEDIGEGEVFELSGNVGADGIEPDRVSELEVWAELDDIPELDNSIEVDTATVLDKAAELDRRTELENAPGLENCVVLDWGTELVVGNGFVDNTELDTSTELGGKAELEAGTVFECSTELDAAIKLEV